MGLRFRKSLQIIPGVRLNFSKSGVSTSVGATGARFTIGKNGVYANAGLPGTGIYMRERIAGGRSTKASKSQISLNEITEQLQEDAEEYNEAAEKKLEIWTQTPHPMKYPVYNRYPFYLPRPEKKSLDKIYKPCFAIVITLFLFSIFSDYQSVAMSVMVIPTAVMAYFYFRNEKEHNKELAIWQSEYDKWDKEQKNLEEDFVAIIDCGKEEPEDALSIAFDNIKWPYPTYISYQVDNNIVFVDVDLPEIEDLPSEVYAVKGRGWSKEVSTKNKTQSKQREDYARHIHGVGMLVCGTIFSVLLHVNTVVVSAYSQRKAKDTNIVNDEYLYSFIATRELWSKINFDRLDFIDPVDELCDFNLRRKMTSGYVLSPIEPYKPSDILAQQEELQ